MSVRADNTFRRLVPSSVAGDLIWELRAMLRHYPTSASTRSKLKGQRHLKANIGCGGRTAAGWVNLDLVKAPDVTCWDCRRGLPFENDSVSVIFAEHMFEHIQRPDATKDFLGECYRCLEPGGIIRLIVPDAGMYLRGYCMDGWEVLENARPLRKNDSGVYTDKWIANTEYRTKMELINNVFRQGKEHKFAYDAETLIMDLESAGFSRVIEQSLGQSLSPVTPLDTPERSSESLYVEAVK